MELKLSCFCVFLQKLIQLSEPRSLHLDRILKLAYLGRAVNPSFLTDSISSLKESLRSFSQEGIFSVSYLDLTPHPCPSGPSPHGPRMDVPKTVISIFDKHDIAFPAPGGLEKVP